MVCLIITMYTNPGLASSVAVIAKEMTNAHFKYIRQSSIMHWYRCKNHTLMFNCAQYVPHHCTYSISISKRCSFVIDHHCIIIYQSSSLAVHWWWNVSPKAKHKLSYQIWIHFIKSILTKEISGRVSYLRQNCLKRKSTIVSIFAREKFLGYQKGS